MAFITAAEFCLTGLALLLVCCGHLLRRTAEMIAATITMTAFAAIVGSFYEVTIFYGGFGYTAMALHTGICFLLLGAALLLAASRSVLAGVLSSPQRGGWLARRLFLAILVVPPLVGKLYLMSAAKFGTPALSMALFAVTIVIGATVTLLLIALSLNRSERRMLQLDRLREASARQALHNERELLLITDQLPTLLSYIDVDGRFVRVNRTYEQWLGRPADEIVGRTVEDLLGHDYWQKTLPARIAIRDGKSVTFDTVYPTLKGNRHAQVTYAPDFDDRGDLRGFAALVLDIHDRFQAESALRQSEKLAAVGRLASSIAHEMNNPLEAVTNLLYLAELDHAKPEESRGYIQQAQTELNRVTHIVTQTLRFHRQSANPTSCQISTIVEQVVSLYQGRLMQKNIAVKERFRDAAPILCRDGEIRQVIANFIGNAADAMEPGGKLLLRTRNTATGGVMLTIADNGSGIDPFIRENLFQPFHTTKGATGSGLGLWISREIVERHNGTIRVRSSQEPGTCGTIFQIFLAGEQI